MGFIVTFFVSFLLSLHTLSASLPPTELDQQEKMATHQNARGIMGIYTGSFLAASAEVFARARPPHRLTVWGMGLASIGYGAFQVYQAQKTFACIQGGEDIRLLSEGSLQKPALCPEDSKTAFRKSLQAHREFLRRKINGAHHRISVHAAFAGISLMFSEVLSDGRLRKACVPVGFLFATLAAKAAYDEEMLKARLEGLNHAARDLTETPHIMRKGKFDMLI